MQCSLHAAAKTQRPLAATQGGRLAGHDAQRVFQALPSMKNAQAAPLLAAGGNEGLW